MGYLEFPAIILFFLQTHLFLQSGCTVRGFAHMKQCAPTGHLEIICDHVAARRASVYGQYGFTDWIIVPLKLRQGGQTAAFLRSRRILTLGDSEEVTELADGRLGRWWLETAHLAQH